MGLARWLFNDFFTAHELDQLDRRAAEREDRTEDELDALHDALARVRADLDRVSLLAKSLADLCVERGVLTREQLHDKVLALDLADGVRDGRLKSSGETSGRQNA